MLSGKVSPSSSGVWTYTGGGTDNWDVSWNPNIYNIMSYSDGNVREYFSPMQIGVMLHWALSIPYSYGHLDPKLNTTNNFIDLFEPDNYRSANNESIAFETVQHRGLHKVITGQPVSPTETHCDQDYIKFVVPVGSTYKINIFTEAVTGRPQVNTEIFLIKIESGLEVVLASNDNKNQENLYSEIMEFEIGEGTYWIKVQSKNNTAGEYNLHLERCKVECCHNYLIGSVTEININTGNFNEGVKSSIFSEEFFGKSVSVNGANFGCNIDFPLGIGGHGYPTTNSMLQLDICNEAEIDVINGSFILGDPENGRNAHVKLNAGTTLKIRDKLLINNNSKLIIGAGAKLIYEHDASIELLGTNSIIEIQDGGLIEIGNGATFTWSGKGYLKVNNDPYDLGKVNIKAAAGATNAKFIKQGEWVSGEGYIEKLIEVETGTFSFDRSLSEVNVKYGVIELGYEAFVDVEPVCYFDNVTFQSNASNQMHNGLWVYGQQNTPYVSGCLFKNALRGLTVYPLVKGVGVTLGNEPISYKSVITNTVFKDCHQSIYINARGAEITNCHITGTGDHLGVRLRGIQYKSFIDKLTARNQAIGVDLLGSGQNEVSVRRSNIHNNGTAGIYGTNVKLSLGCDKIYENYSASFQGQNIWLANGSHFIAQNTLSHGSMLNDLHSTNSTSVFLDNVFGIHIDNGFNNFVSNGYAIWGSIIPYQVTNNPSQYESIKVVYGQNNYWNTQGASPQFGDYAVVYNDGWTYYLTHIDDIGQSLSTAPNLPENCSYGTISNDPPSMFLGKAPLFDPNGVPLDEVWIEARDFMNEGNFSQAYDRFNDIVSYNYDTSFTIMGSSDIYTSEFREWYDVIQMAYSKMIECINQSVALGQIDANTYELDGIFGVQDNLLAKFGSNDTLNTELKFEYNFDKAMLYRLTNKQTLCLTKITNMLSHAHISAHNIKLLNYYACLVEKENRMLNDSTLTKAEYFQVFDCDTLLEIPNMGPPDYQEEKTGVAENTQSKTNQEINLYPNPANDYLFVSLVKPASNIQVNVFDLMGKLIVSKEIKENTQLIQMPLDMSDGSYIMQITTDNYTARKRFMIVK